MTDTTGIEAASKRLSLAMDALEAAVQRRRDADRSHSTLVAQAHALGTDRSRLASELDAASARAKALETANREIARRLDMAIETIRNVLESNDR